MVQSERVGEEEEGEEEEVEEVGGRGRRRRRRRRMRRRRRRRRKWIMGDGYCLLVNYMSGQKDRKVDERQT